MLNVKSNKRGDTLIEVLFASAVFSLIAVGGISIMNQGTATIQRSYEITLVRQEIDAQASALRFLNASYVASYSPGLTTYNGPAAQWASLDNAIDTSRVFISFGVSGNSCPSKQVGSFIINTLTGEFISSPNFSDPVTYSRVDYGSPVTAQGIWIEAEKVIPTDSFQLNTAYIDFHIKACWVSPGQSLPITLGTVVRLYEPHN